MCAITGALIENETVNGFLMRKNEPKCPEEFRSHALTLEQCNAYGKYKYNNINKTELSLHEERKRASDCFKLDIH